MQNKLLPLVNQFIYVRQGFFSRYYEGKLVEVTPETLTLQAYDEEGNEEAVWVMQLSTVTEFMVGDSDLTTLSDKVKMAETRTQLQKLFGFNQQAVVTNPGAPVLSSVGGKYETTTEGDNGNGFGDDEPPVAGCSTF